jgi:transposase
MRTFAAMLTGGAATGLLAWIAAVRTSGLPGLTGFAAALADDLDAVIAGLRMSWSSGVVEGRVTDVKMLERQMAGRAGLPLLHKRILLLAASRRMIQPEGAPPDHLWLINSTKIL